MVLISFYLLALNLVIACSFQENEISNLEEKIQSLSKENEFLAAQMKNMERYANTVSSITKYLMYPTDYSDI